MAVQIHTVPSLPPRQPDSHKGTYGKVLIIAGSPGMCGAAVLAARAALRAGSGLVTVAVPASLTAAVTQAVPEATQVLLPELDGPDYSAALDRTLPGDIERRFDAVAIGPGLGTSPSSRLLLERVLAHLPVPEVLDADALNLVAAGAAVRRSEQRLWTPHPGEFRRLTRNESPQGDEQRVAACERFATARGGVVVLKGHRTIVHDGERFFVNVSGNPGMATGGSGDVLTGILASLLGQGLAPFDAASLGVQLHGVAGDLAARRLGSASLIASDIVESVPAALDFFTAPADRRRFST